MKNTRFMDRLFSAVEENDEKLTAQVANDIDKAATGEVVDTDEVKYENAGDGKVAITDKENGEVTIAEKAEDGNYDLSPAEVTPQPEGFLHPERDGVTPGNQKGAPDEHVENHMDGSSVIAPSRPDGGLNYEAGHEKTVEENACQGEDCKEFSVSSDNTVVQRIFSDQIFCERVFSEVIESEETAKVGNLKIEKLDDEDNSVVVTDLGSGDQAKVTLDDDEMEVTELDSKNFSEEGEEGECDANQYCPLHIVGVDAGNHVLVDAVEYDEDEANDLAARLSEQGVDAVQIFEDEDEARDYALELLGNLGAESFDDVEEPEEATFSDIDGYSHDVYATRFYSTNTVFMDRLFSETDNDIDASQSKIEDALENGDEIETDTEIITPVDSCTAVVEDKDSGEFTKVVIEDDIMNTSALSEDEANELFEDIHVSEDDDDDDEEDEDEEKKFSDIYQNEEGTKFFSESEPFNNYMTRLYTDESDSDAIEDAIENGDEVETDNEVITPVDSSTAVVKDKESGDFTKATLDDDTVDVEPITEEEADELLGNIEVSEDEEDEDEKKFSDIYQNEEGTKFFSESEPFNNYMARLYSDESDSNDIEKAIEDGEQIETDNEVITPIDSCTAVVEDKENGEFTKATLDDNTVDVEPITEEEADKLTEDLQVEDKDDDEDEKKFSYYEDPILDKFFTDILAPQATPAQIPAQAQGVQAQGQGVAVPVQTQVPAEEEAPSIESIEDKAVAAVQSIQAAAAEAEATILNAKAAPSETTEADLQEAQFSQKEFAEQDTLVSWFVGNNLGNK